MKNNTKTYLRKGIAGFILLFGILAIYNAITSKNLDQLLWFCYISLILIGIGTYYKKDYLILTQLSIITIPIIIWNLDFFYMFFINKELFGITNYLFNKPIITLGNIVSLQHIFILFLGIFALELVEFKTKKTWILLLSFIQILIVGIMSLLFGNPQSNVNCIFEPCFNIQISQNIYLFTWFSTMFILIFLNLLFIISIHTYINQNKSSQLKTHQYHAS